MKIEIGKAANDGFAACGHPVLAGEAVLRLEHDGHVAMICRRKPCSAPFHEADEKLDELKALHPKEHARLLAVAEGLASEKAAASKIEWDHLDDRCAIAKVEADAALLEAETERKLAEQVLPPGAEIAPETRSAKHAAAEHRHANAARAHYQISKLREEHHLRARTPGFHAAAAWLDAVRSA